MPRRDPNIAGLTAVSGSPSDTDSTGESRRSSTRWSFSFPRLSASHNSSPHDSLSRPVDSLQIQDSDHDGSQYIVDNENASSSVRSNLALGPALLFEHRRLSQTESPSYFPVSYSETRGGIRDDTALLSDMLLSPRDASGALPHLHHYLTHSSPRGRQPSHASQPQFTSWTHTLQQQPLLQLNSSDMAVSDSEESDDDALQNSSSTPTPRAEQSPEGIKGSAAVSPSAANRSILTMLLERERHDSTASDRTAISREQSNNTAGKSFGKRSTELDTGNPQETTGNFEAFHDRRRIADEEEGTALLSSSGGETPVPTYGITTSTTTPRNHAISPTRSISKTVISALYSARGYAAPKALGSGFSMTLNLVPAVMLGLLINILDGVSYGFIMFPSGPVFAGFGSSGVSMFFVTTVISQLVYAFGGSAFPGATGSMIIEVIPFFHIMAATITSQLGEENSRAIVASTMVAFTLSSILTGLAFLIFGLLNMGSIIGFFPRHILVGCIGGVGAFLIQTGLNVSAGLGEEEADLTWRLLKLYFTDAHVLSLWTPAFALAVLLRLITHKYHHQLIFPAYFVALPIIFYITVFSAGYSVDELRQNGWVFDVGSSHESWYHFYSYFDFHATSWKAVWATMPTQLALLFFNILHPPLNVPALGVSLNKDEVDLNLELTGHGVSNLLAGCAGVPSNYLAYVNTLLFNRVGGKSRYSGFLLAMATFGLLLVGTGPIAYIPVLEVGALIFVLGIDLVKEAVWDTWPRTSRFEYITIIGIMLSMTVYDFVSGVLFGFILSSLFFVIQNSQRRSIRDIFTGSAALSTVRRPSAHRRYLQEVGTQTCIIHIQGHLFFGTISQVEEKCRALLDQHEWKRNPIRFLVIDLALVAGLDLSAAEAFVRVHRLLVAKRVILVFCGQSPTSDVAVALQAVGLWSNTVEVFATLNEALEWTENAYLRAWYSSPSKKHESPQRTGDHTLSVREPRDNLPFLMSESFVNSPRRTQVQNSGSRIMDEATTYQDSPMLKDQPYNTFVKTFSSHIDLNDEFIARVAPYFRPQAVSAGDTVYQQGDQADGLYLIESGVLRATYRFGDHVPAVEENCVAGTLSGELSALAGEPRNATVTAERASVLWKLSNADLARLEEDHPRDARLLIKLVLKASKIDQDVLLTNLAQHHL